MQFVNYLFLHRTSSIPLPLPPPPLPSHLFPSPTTSFLLSTPSLFLPISSPVSRLYILHYPTSSPSHLIFFVYSPLLRTSSNSSLPRPISHLLLLIRFLPLQSLSFFFELKRF